MIRNVAVIEAADSSPRIRSGFIATIAMVAAMLLGPGVTSVHAQAGVAAFTAAFASGTLRGRAERKNLKDFHLFLQQHGDIETDLKATPASAKDSGYIQNHADLAAFLDKHKPLAQQLARHPAQILARAEKIKTG